MARRGKRKRTGTTTSAAAAAAAAEAAEAAAGSSLPPPALASGTPDLDEKPKKAAGKKKSKAKAKAKAPKRKAKAKALKRDFPSPSFSDDDDEDEESEEEQSDDDEDSADLNVEFEFFDPNEDDYHSVGDLVKNGLWEFLDLNFAELADSIVGQGNIGTLVKSEAEAASKDASEEKTVCGLLTCLNLRQFAAQSWPKTILEALAAKAQGQGNGEAATKLKSYIKPTEGVEVGLVFSERFVNLPPQLIPPLHKALVEDIDWSFKTPECPDDERPFYGFTHFVSVARCYEAAPGEEDPASKAEVPAKKRKKGGAARAGSSSAAASSTSSSAGLVFPRPEDEFYFNKASFRFTFPVTSSGAEKQRGGGNAEKARGQERRAVYGLTRKAFEQAVKEIEASPAFVPN
mmetsp:Transcript_57040/g.121204  ORF Transcript_57040/g.121204 Transcript_57040/m.121204 type:complete len:402 (+) Transcript_57040:62-1267(+)